MRNKVTGWIKSEAFYEKFDGLSLYTQSGSQGVVKKSTFADYFGQEKQLSLVTPFDWQRFR